MSLEQKIKTLLEAKQKLEEKLTLPASNNAPGEGPIAQGSSQQPEIDEIDETQPGVDVANKAKPETPPQMQGDAQSVSVPAMEASEAASLKDQVKGLFEGVENVSDEFVNKATGIFEAAVIARTNDEVIKLTEQLEAKAESELAALKGTLAEQIDKYVGYVVESWMKENQVAIDAGLRTEIAESFMLGLKNMFQENFIQVPEDKVDVLEKVTSELTEAKANADRLMEQNAALLAQKQSLERAAVLESASKELTAFDAERLVRLVEGVDFESKDLFEEKVKMIREAHFKKTAKKSAEAILEEGVTGVDNSVQDGAKHIDPNMAAYVSAFKTGSGFTS